MQHSSANASMVGGDSIYAFDYAGKLLAAAAVDPHQPLATTWGLIARNGGRPQRPDGTWAMHMNRQVFRIVALDSTTAAVYVAPYDARVGTDLMEGGTIVAMGLAGRELRHLGRSDVPAGLYGRDRAGRALLLGYTDAAQETIRVSRLSLTPRTGRAP